MKKYLLPFLFLFLIYKIAGAQESPSAIPFVAYWQVGDIYDFKVSKITQKFSDGLEKENERTEYLASFEVIDSTATSYTIKWNYQHGLTEKYKLSESLKKTLSENEFSELIYTTTETGIFQEIINWEEVGSLMTKIFDDIFKETTEKLEGEAKEKMAQSFETIKQTYSTKASVEQIIFKELQYFHYLMGLEYDVDKALKFEDELPNMFGGDPIKGKAKLYVSEIEPEESFVVMKHEMTLDEKDSKELLLQVFQKMGLQSKEVTKMVKKSDFNITDDNRFEFFYYPCIPLKIETKRETILVMEGVNTKRVDQVIIELVTYEED